MHGDFVNYMDGRSVNDVLKYILSLALAVLLVWFAFRSVDWTAFWEGLKQTRWGYLAPFFAASVGALPLFHGLLVGGHFSVPNGDDGAVDRRRPSHLSGLSHGKAHELAVVAHGKPARGTGSPGAARHRHGAGQLCDASPAGAPV